MSFLSYCLIFLACLQYVGLFCAYRATTFIPSTYRIYIHEPGQYWISSCVADLSIHACLICGSCSSGRDFARRVYFLPPTSGFLQIPPRDGHPCLRLTLPTTKRVADFHRRVVAHAWRTTKMSVRILYFRTDHDTPCWTRTSDPRAVNTML